MEPNDAAADTAKALEAALEAAYREQEALTRRLDTVSQLIDHLSRTAAETAAVHPPAAGARSGSSARRAGRSGAKKATGRKATAKRSRKRTARRSAKKTSRQAPGRTDRVVEIVNASGEPLSTGDVRARLQQEEPDVSSKLVSAALTYAARKGRVQRHDGQWVGA